MEIERAVLGPWRDAWRRRDGAAFRALLAPDARLPSMASATRTVTRSLEGVTEHAWALADTRGDAAEVDRYLAAFTRVDDVALDAIGAEVTGDRAVLELRFDLRAEGAAGRRQDRGVLRAEVVRREGRWALAALTAPGPCESLSTDVGRASAYEDITERAGLAGVPVVDRREAIRRGGYAVSSADYDNDGRPDLAIGNWGPMKLYRNAGGRYEDVTEAAGLRGETLVKSAAFADLDNDGLRDLVILRFVDRPAPEPGAAHDPQRGREGDGDLVAYRNAGNGRFEYKGNILSRQRHYDRSMPLAVADFDGNGTLDLYVGFPGSRDFTNDLARTGARVGLARQGLWLNDGRWNFTEATPTSAMAASTSVFPHAALATDLSGDGRPDLVVIDDSGHISPVYRNEGNGEFSDATRAMGLDRKGWGMGGAAADFDGDGRTDIVLTNVSLAARERIARAWRGRDLSALPPTVREELTTLGAQGVFLFRNKGDGTFEDVTARAGVTWAGGAPAGAEWVDYNHDGRLDLYVANGLWSGGAQNVESFFVRVVDDRATRHLGLNTDRGPGAVSPAMSDLLMSLPADAQRHPNPMLSVLREFRGTLESPQLPPSSERPSLSLAGYQRNRLFRNNGDGTFTDVGYLEGADRVEDGYMTSTADVDLDGRQDLVLRNADPPPGYTFPTVVVLRNRHEGRALTVALQGTRSNRDGIGAMVTVTAGGRRMVREVRSANGAVQGEPVAYFGLGADRAESVEVSWPGGLRERFAPAEGARVTLREGAGTSIPR